MKNNLITLGADPEFEIVFDASIIEAYNVISDPGRVNPIGLDGNASTGELRPRPGSWGQLYYSLSDLIRKADNRKIKMSVKGDVYALGGHIHFGGDVFKFDYTRRDIIKAMDSYVYPLLKPLEGTARGGYAGSGNFEIKPYGFEYRSLPAGWMACPELAKLTLKLSYKIAKSVIYYGLQADGKPVAADYGNYKHFVNKRDFSRLLQLVNMIKTCFPPVINTLWTEKIKLNNSTLFTKKVEKGYIIFRDDYPESIKKEITEDYSVINYNIVFFGLAPKRGENLIYCPDLPELANIIGANHIKNFVYGRRYNIYDIAIGLTPDLRTKENIIKIMCYVRDNY